MISLFAKRRTYLDWAAAAPASKAAGRAHARALKAYGNPSSPHEEGRASKAILEDARTRVARLVGAKADDVVFTSGATEANNLAIAGHVQARMAGGMANVGTARENRAPRMPARAAKDIHLIYMPSAHASVVETMQKLERQGCAVEPLAVRDGAIDISALAKQVRPETALVAIDAVCGETGTTWNGREVRHALDAARGAGQERIILHVDASQAPLIGTIERARFGADTMTLDAQKAGGIRGIGALIAPRTIPLAPLMRGGGQERAIRPGTPSPALATAFAIALDECKSAHEAFAERALRARSLMLDYLVRFDLGANAGVHINEGKQQAPHILNLSLVGRDTDYLVALLDRDGFAVSTKSACETDSATGSRAILALTNDPGRAASTLRVSWGPSTSGRDLLRFADALVRNVRFLDRLVLPPSSQGNRNAYEKGP